MSATRDCIAAQRAVYQAGRYFARRKELSPLLYKIEHPKYAAPQ